MLLVCYFLLHLLHLLPTSYFRCSGVKRGGSGKIKSKGSNVVLRKKRGRPSLRTEAQALHTPSSIPTRVEFSRQQSLQHGSIVANRRPTPLAAEKQFGEEQRIDDPMSPLSPCTETSAQNASPARSTISLQAGSTTVSRVRHPLFY
jgi:hypothetical protein